jgi:hypothetical protein
MGTFRSVFLAAPSATAASQDTLSLRRRFGRGDFIHLVNVEGIYAPNHGRHQMGPNSGVQWDRSRDKIPELYGLIFESEKGFWESWPLPHRSPPYLDWSWQIFWRTHKPNPSIIKDV